MKDKKFLKKQEKIYALIKENHFSDAITSIKKLTEKSERKLYYPDSNEAFHNFLKFLVKTKQLNVLEEFVYSGRYIRVSNLPFELYIDIIKNLPPQSLNKFTNDFRQEISLMEFLYILPQETKQKVDSYTTQNFTNYFPQEKAKIFIPDEFISPLVKEIIFLEGNNKSTFFNNKLNWDISTLDKRVIKELKSLYKKEDIKQLYSSLSKVAVNEITKSYILSQIKTDDGLYYMLDYYLPYPLIGLDFILQNIKVINAEGDIRFYALVIKASDCLSIDMLSKFLSKTNLPIKSAKELLLQRSQKSCQI